MALNDEIYDFLHNYLGFNPEDSKKLQTILDHCGMLSLGAGAGIGVAVMKEQPGGDGRFKLIMALVGAAILGGGAYTVCRSAKHTVDVHLSRDSGDVASASKYQPPEDRESLRKELQRLLDIYENDPGKVQYDSQLTA